MLCLDCTKYGTVWHSGECYHCDLCGRPTHHWYRHGDMPACTECHTRIGEVGFEQAYEEIHILGGVGQ
jgi:hypothetical protein